jgi:hypothetical protein
MCAATTERSLAGIKPRCDRKLAAIIAAGVTKEVAFEPVNGSINDRVDDAYRSKYARSPYLKPMIGARARAATVRIVPRDANGPVAE